MSRLPSYLKKIALLFSILAFNRIEFCDRIRHIIEVKGDAIMHPSFNYECVEPFDLAIEDLLGDLNLNFRSNLIEEVGLLEIEKEVKKGLQSLQSNAPFRITHSADIALARLCYLICRAKPPEIVIETGVAFGVTSAFILKAMSINKRGILHSIDLPPLGIDSNDYVGSLIPFEIRDRWQLHRGTSRRILPELLRENPPINLFIHDSLHTYSHMLWEFNTVTPRLEANGILISDDIADNRAFQTWVEQAKPSKYKVIRKKGNDRLIGYGRI